MQDKFNINYEVGSGVYSAETDTVTLKFDRTVDSLQLYPYDSCKSGNDTPSPVNTAGIVITIAPGPETVELAFQEAVRENTDVYTESFSAIEGLLNDSLKLCVYAATVASNGDEVGFAEVRIALTYSASGSISGMDIVDGQVNEVADPLTFSEAFGGLEASMCSAEVTTISQGQTVGICIKFISAADISEFRMDQIVSCQYDMGDVNQQAINGNTAANVLTEYSYSCGTAPSDACSELQFNSNLRAEFFLKLDGVAKLRLNCLVDVIPILTERRLASDPNRQQYKTELDLILEPEKEINLVMIITGAIGGVCLLCLMCCLYAFVKRRRHSDDNDKHRSEEDDDGQCTLKSADISSDVEELPKASAGSSKVDGSSESSDSSESSYCACSV